ncbi:hypothetical protein HanRHA438_Chr15g0720681 [Helianthus annuus]|nr:hypothetical protein HanRHA438_Chr15g0720681 [Helianthus annuus]
MILNIRKMKTQFWWVWVCDTGRTRRGGTPPTSPTQQEINKLDVFLDEIRMHVINFSFI